MKIFYALCLLFITLTGCSLDQNTYRTDQFSLFFPKDWTPERPGVFVHNGSKEQITFSHVMGDFDAPIYEKLNTENYTDPEGLVWTIHTYAVRDEYHDLYSESFRFVEIDMNEKSFADSTFLYSYDEELNSDAVLQLKKILDSYETQ